MMRVQTTLPMSRGKTVCTLIHQSTTMGCGTTSHAIVSTSVSSEALQMFQSTPSVSPAPWMKVLPPLLDLNIIRSDGAPSSTFLLKQVGSMIPMALSSGVGSTTSSTSTTPTTQFGAQCTGATRPAQTFSTGNICQSPFILTPWVQYFPAVLWGMLPTQQAGPLKTA